MPIQLPPHFQFSQASLQAFSDCPRRFYLRYVQRVAWPAQVVGEALEYERQMQQGAAFHRLAQQHALGISAERLSHVVAAQGDADLHRWWDNYLNHPPSGLPGARYPEITLSVPVAGRRLLAKYDLLAIAPGERAVIVDWKTGRRQRRVWYAGRWQTRVYRYVLAAGAGAHLNEGEALQAEQVSMMYWFADAPGTPEHFPYNAADFARDHADFAQMVEGIETMDEKDFSLTGEAGRCKYCPYRSLCRRGVAAGPLSEVEDAPEAGEAFDFDFDFDQVQEIEF